MALAQDGRQPHMVLRVKRDPASTSSASVSVTGVSQSFPLGFHSPTGSPTGRRVWGDGRQGTVRHMQ